MPFRIAVVFLAFAPLAAASAAVLEPLRPPTKLHVVAGGRTSLRLSWKASSDKARLTGYDVYRSGRRVASVGKASTSYIFRGLRCGTSYVVGVAAHDDRGATSRRPTARGRTTLCPARIDTQGPTAPTNLHVTATTSSSVSLAWEASTDNVGVTRYVAVATWVMGLMSFGATTTGTDVTISGLPCNVVYAVSVVAYDAAGNGSAPALLPTGVGIPCPGGAGQTSSRASSRSSPSRVTR